MKDNLVEHIHGFYFRSIRTKVVRFLNFTALIMPVYGEIKFSDRLSWPCIELILFYTTFMGSLAKIVESDKISPQ